MARPLVIDESAKKRVAELVEFASRPQNVYEPRPGVPPPGDNPDFVTHLDHGFRCVFTHTRDPKGKMFRHLSVSVDSRGYPNEYAMGEIASLFGFTGWDLNTGFNEELASKHGWILAIHEDEHCVVLAQAFDGNEKKPEESRS